MANDQQFPKSRRLLRKADFQRVFNRKVKTNRGPLTFFLAAPATREFRLGLSVRRTVGNAVQRNQIKRMLREAFRLSREQLSGPFDLIIVPRPHDLLSLEQYRDMMEDAVRKLALRLNGGEGVGEKT